MCMFKKMSHRVFAFMLTVLLLTVVAAPSVSAASADDGKFCIEVVGLKEEDDSLIIEFEYENRCDNRISYGWVDSCNLIVETDEGLYSTALWSISNGLKIGQGEGRYTISGCEGEVEKITLSELILLGDNGLPFITIHDVVIYEDGETGFMYDFPFTAFIMTYWPFFVVGIVIITTITIIIIVERKQHKKRMASFQPFNNDTNGFAPPTGTNDAVQQAMHQQQVQDMAHQQAVDMHNMAHQQAVDMHNMAHQQHMQTVQTHIDHNNFMPPPTM